MKGTALICTVQGNQTVTTVYESGLYKLIFKSRKKIAEKFQDWIFEVVLPEIRKTGSYNGNKKTLPLGIDPSRFQYYRPIEDGKAKWEKAFFKSQNWEKEILLIPKAMQPQYHRQQYGL